MNSSRISKRHIGRQLAVGLLTAGIASVSLAVPAYAEGVNAVTVFDPLINAADASGLVISGTADSAVNAVVVTVRDDNGATVSGPATLTGAAGTQLSWTTTLPLNVSPLLDGLVAIVVTYDNVAGTNEPLVPKDTVGPDEAPTVFPAGGAFAAPTDIFIESVSDRERTRFTFGAAPADPTQGLGSADVPLPPAVSHTVSTTQQVKAITFDLAGNPSPIRIANFTITRPTTTTLAASVVSPQVAGTAVALTASVDPVAAVGSYEFFDGGVSLGVAGAATKVITPTVGTHSYTAKFVPANTDYSTSTSVASAFTITAAPAPAPAPVPAPVVIAAAAPVVIAAAPPVVVLAPAAPPAAIAPKVIARAPAIKGSGVSLTGNITAKFSADVTGVTNKSFTLRTRGGKLVPAVVTYNNSTRVATLNPTPTLAADTSYVATLSNSVKAGVALATTNWSFITGPRPTVKVRTPGVNVKQVARAANVTATFSEKVSGVSGSSLMLMTSTGKRVAAVVTYNAKTGVATLNPTKALAAGTKYTVVLGGAIKDRAGNAVAAVRWSFTTSR